MYRPFFKQHLYLGEGLLDRARPCLPCFPRIGQLGIYVSGAGPTNPFAVLMTDAPPDLHLLSAGKFFPRWTYEKSDDEDLFTKADDRPARTDNVTDTALSDYRATYGEQVTKDDIFFYVYGLLHSPMYRVEFAADLKKMLPRIPQVDDFAGFTDAGRRLAELHLGYESVEPYPLDEQVTGADRGAERYRVQKMIFIKAGKGKDKSRIAYNSRMARWPASPTRHTGTCSARARLSSGSWTATRSGLTSHRES